MKSNFRVLVPMLSLATAFNVSAEVFTKDNGAPIGDNQNSITAGSNGSVLLEDVHLIQKLQRFHSSFSSRNYFHSPSPLHLNMSSTLASTSSCSAAIAKGLANQTVRLAIAYVPCLSPVNQTARLAHCVCTMPPAPTLPRFPTPNFHDYRLRRTRS